MKRILKGIGLFIAIVFFPLQTLTVAGIMLIVKLVKKAKAQRYAYGNAPIEVEATVIDTAVRD